MTIADDTQTSAMGETADSVSNNVKVVVRVRPPNDLEGGGQHRNIVEIMNENVLVFDPKEEASPSFGRHGRRHRDIRKRRQKDMKFAFDYVFGAESTNVEVFQETTNTVLDGLLSGYNCSVFAYGATGAGKTHTMLGNEAQPGVIYHTMIQLYRRIDDVSQDKTCDVAVSYLEVYNEQIRDLLLPRGTLPIREDRNAGVLVPGLSLHKPSNAEELLHMLQFGNKNRTQHPTDANSESSRSHAVFQVFVRQRDRTANISAEVKVAKMCLVDLAGSERATVTKNRGARFREGANINRSLLALGNVINSLADQKFKGHIPYRDSKLTRLLKDSLGGNCRTIMIAAVSPSALSYEDTYNTLKYADRAKNIRLNIKKNVLNVDFHVSRYGKIVEDLRREIAELKGKLERCEAPQVNPLALAIPADVQSLREKLQAVYTERRAVRDQQLKQECCVRDTQWRLHRKQKCLQRTQHLSAAQPEMLHKIQATVQGLQQKLLGQESHRQALSSRLLDNTHALSQLHAQVLTPQTQSTAMSQLLQLSVQKLGLEVELNDSRHYMRHLRRLARAQEREAMASERLIIALLRLVQRQQNELQNRGPLPADISDSYKHVCDLVGECGVSWADDDDSEGGQPPFHINSVIDIPLVSHSGMTEHGVPSLPLPASHISSTGVPTSASGSTKPAPAISCPGRVINGQTVFSSPASSVASQPGGWQSEVIWRQTCSASDAFTQNGSSATVAEKSHSPVLQPSTAQPSSSSVCSGASGNGSDGMSTVGYSKSSAASAYAGHTPAPKKSAYSPAVSHRGSRQSAAGDCLAKQSVNETFAYPKKHNLNETFDSSRQHSLNETFSLENENVRNVDGGSTVVLTVPTVFNVPVIDSFLSLSTGNVPRTRLDPAGNSLPQTSNVLSDITACHQNSTNTRVVTENMNNQQNKSNMLGTSAENVSCSNTRTVTPCTQPNRTPADRHLTEANEINSGTVTKMLPGGDMKVATETVTKSSASQVEGKENAGESRPHSNVARAINFDGVVSSPMRVEGRSYADAVKTPSPARQPLQALDCNSPQVMANRLPSAPCQTPKGRSSGGGRASMYVAGPQALDNMRRLKQFGLPSLVENLVTGKSGVSANTTSTVSTSQPSYMQPTMAVARRVRLQQKSFRDDSFQPKRVTHNMSRNRSKSATSLSRAGWKI